MMIAKFSSFSPFMPLSILNMHVSETVYLNKQIERHQTLKIAYKTNVLCP